MEQSPHVSFQVAAIEIVVAGQNATMTPLNHHFYRIFSVVNLRLCVWTPMDGVAAAAAAAAAALKQLATCSQFPTSGVCMHDILILAAANGSLVRLDVSR